MEHFQAGVSFLDPIHFAAAVYLLSPEQEKEMLAIMSGDCDIDLLVTASEYLVRTLGMQRIAETAQAMIDGKIPLPLELPPVFRGAAH